MNSTSCMRLRSFKWFKAFSLHIQVVMISHLNFIFCNFCHLHLVWVVCVTVYWWHCDVCDCVLLYCIPCHFLLLFPPPTGVINVCDCVLVYSFSSTFDFSTSHLCDWCVWLCTCGSVMCVTVYYIFSHIYIFFSPATCVSDVCDCVLVAVWCVCLCTCILILFPAHNVFSLNHPTSQ